MLGSLTAGVAVAASIIVAAVSVPTLAATDVQASSTVTPVVAHGIDAPLSIDPGGVVHAPPAPGSTRYLFGNGVIGSAASLQFSNLTLTVGATTVRGKNPDVNPQHTTVVFEQWPGFLALINPDGSGLRPLGPQSGGGWMEPRFTPDGLHVVATHDLGGTAGNEIFSVDVTTGQAVQLTSTGSLQPFKWRPSVDPGGTRLIVTYGSGDMAHAHVGWAPLGRGLITDFTPLTAVDTTLPSYDGAYSLDGASIVYDAGGWIWVADANGGGAHRVVPGRLGRFDPLAPGRILYSHDISSIDLHTQLWSANADGTDARMVADANLAESFCDLP